MKELGRFGANADGRGGGCSWLVNIPIPIDRTGDGERMEVGGEFEFKSMVSTSVFEWVDMVLLRVEAEIRLWYFSDMRDPFREYL